MKTQLEQVADFISKQNLGVVSTVTHDGKPEAAVMGISQNGNYELLFGTFVDSRKYSNLKLNPYVAVVIGWDAGITVQYEGVAEEITDEAGIEEFKRIHLAKIPSAAKFVDNQSERFFLVKPKLIKYSDWSLTPVESFEIKF